MTLSGLAGVTRLPRWALSLAALGCAFIAVQAWSFGTYVAYIAETLPEDVFGGVDQNALLMQLFLLPSMLVSLVGFSSLAMVGWRRKAMSRGASVLLILAGLVVLLGPFPTVGLLGGLALAGVARSAVVAD